MTHMVTGLFLWCSLSEASAMLNVDGLGVNQLDDSSFYCEICDISTTSAGALAIHCAGWYWLKAQYEGFFKFETVDIVCTVKRCICISQIHGDLPIYD